MSVSRNSIFIFLLLVLFFSETNVFCQTDIHFTFKEFEDYERMSNLVRELTNAAIIDIKEEKQEEALQKLSRAVAVDSTYRQIYLQIYQAGLLNIENTDSVIEVLHKGERIFQEDDELHFYCAEIYRLKSETDKAILEYNAAIKYAKKNGEDFYLVPYYYFNRGNIYMKKNKLELALNDYNYSIKLKPDFFAGLTNRGICLFKLGNTNEACLDWKKAASQGYQPAQKYYEKYKK